MIELILAVGSLVGTPDWALEPLPVTAPVYSAAYTSRYARRPGPSTRFVFVVSDDHLAWANIAIEGHVFRLVQTRTKTSGHDHSSSGVGLTHADTFSDLSHGLTVEKVVTVKRFSDEANTDWEEGVLKITYAGKTRTVSIGGGYLG